MPALDQIRRERAGHIANLVLIEIGAMRPHRDGVDITEEVKANALGRIALADAILRDAG